MNHIELPEKSGAYRWYYVDVAAGDFTAVFIFMIGSIFSAKYSTSLKKGGLPREHAAVNFALYEKGVRYQWVLTEYAKVAVSEDGRRLSIGDSWLQYEDGRLTAEVKDKTTPFMMTNWGSPTHVKLDFVPEGPTHPEIELVPGLSHRWRPIAARGRATVRLEHLDEAQRHRGVVGPRPGRAAGHVAVLEREHQPLVGHEEALAEGVADGQAIEAPAHQVPVGHRAALYAEGCHRAPAVV